MTQGKQDIFNKWKPIMDSMGVTGSKLDWLSQYAENFTHHESNLSGLPNLTSKTTSTPKTTPDFGSFLLPLSMKIAAQTIGKDLVSVVPIGGGNSGDELRRIDNELKQENRDGKIDSIIEDKEYVEKERKDHPDYIISKCPTGQLFYMDYNYNSSTQSGSNRPESLI